MNQHLIRAGLLLGLGLGSSAWAESGGPVVSSPQGEYLQNTGPVLGRVPQRSGPTAPMPGALWRVVSPWLNCRQQPDPQAPIRQRFRRGSLIQANVYWGGSDEVLKNPRDSRGLYWMAVRTQQGHDLECYVRAHRSFIRPLK